MFARIMSRETLIDVAAQCIAYKRPTGKGEMNNGFATLAFPLSEERLIFNF